MDGGAVGSVSGIYARPLVHAPPEREPSGELLMVPISFLSPPHDRAPIFPCGALWYGDASYSGARDSITCESCRRKMLAT